MLYVAMLNVIRVNVMQLNVKVPNKVHREAVAASPSPLISSKVPTNIRINQWDSMP